MSTLKNIANRTHRETQTYRKIKMRFLSRICG